MSLSTEQLLKNYDEVRHRIDNAAQTAFLPAPMLLAVSKTKPAHMVQDLYDCGHREFGENYVQDAYEKIQALTHLDDISWHFIGQIQSNKTKTIAENFQWVHSIDRMKTARRLNNQRPKHLPPLNICIQVNVDDEHQKGGVSLEELPTLAAELDTLPHIRLRGLMSIPQATHSEEQQQRSFKQLKLAFDHLIERGLALDTLSMGMSRDLESAVSCGSTCLRIGTDIFGARD